MSDTATIALWSATGGDGGGGGGGATSSAQLNISSSANESYLATGSKQNIINRQNASALKVLAQIVTELPDPTANNGLYKQYAGEDTATLTKGHIYLSDGTAWTDAGLMPEGGGTDDYTQLTNKPSISNGTTSVQLIGTIDLKQQLGVLTSADKTELQDLANTKGRYIQLLYTSTTNKLKVDLLNKDNQVISTSQVDLLLEGLITNATYDNTTKEITLTIKDVTDPLVVNIGDIVSGLVNETTEASKVYGTSTSGLQTTYGVQDTIPSTPDNLNIPTSKAVKDYVDENGGMLIESVTTLWTGTQSSAGTITLSANYSDFDKLEFKLKKNENIGIFQIDTREIALTSSSYKIIMELGWDMNLRYVRFYKNSNPNQLQLDIVDCSIIEISGIKANPIQSLTQSISSSSLATEIPSAKAVYDFANIEFKEFQITRSGSFTPGSYTITGTISTGYKVIACYNFGTEGVVGGGYITTWSQSGTSFTCSGWWGYVNGSSPASVIWVKVLCVKL